MDSVRNSKKINMKFWFLIVLVFVLSCKKSDRIEIQHQGKFEIKKTYQNDMLISTVVYDDKRLINQSFYKNNTLYKVLEYYPNGEIKIISELIKEPNHFYDIFYSDNGKVKSKGESDYIKKNGRFLKRGGTIFYTEDGKIAEIMDFINNGEEDFLIRHTILDTLKNTIVSDDIYDPPLKKP